jgi:ABC-type nitrate/sulfonate/bicarbonate transport system permease component
MAEPTDTPVEPVEADEKVAEEAPSAPQGGEGTPIHGWFALRRELPRWGKVALGGVLVLAVLGLWSWATSGAPEQRVVAPTILPSPGEVMAGWDSLVHERHLYKSILATLKRVFTGFGLAVLIGVPLGMAAGAWRPLAALLEPLVLFARNIPIAALVPLTMVWFGLEESQKIMFIFMATFAFIFSDASAEVSGIHERYVETGQTLGAKPRQIFLRILVPLALPNIFTKLRALFGLAFGYIMLAELVNTNSGLGFLLRMSQRRGNTEHMFLILFVITALAFLIDRGLVWFQRGLFPYRKDIR